MARYAIGDVQGCFDELQYLLHKINYRPGQDRIFFVGDLVNRGPSSLSVLRWAWQERSHISVVLGNHDLHLLACSVDASKCKQGDTLDELLHAPDAPVLIDWLRRQPLLLVQSDCLITHAGIHPEWDERTAIALSEDVSSLLSSDNYQDFLMGMYGNEPKSWAVQLSEMDRARFAVNVFTRMRMVNRSGSLNFKFKGELERAPASLCAWFDYPTRLLSERRIVFGHWSALGLLMRDTAWALDTGCVWGGHLTAVCLDNGTLFQVQACRAYQSVCE